MFPSTMGETNENIRINSSKERSNLSLQMEKYPRDLLQRFMSTETQASITSEREEDEAEEEVELNLGLSLGGRFGVDKNAKKLIRSSSIASSMPTSREEGANNTPPTIPYPTLIRTSSLPTETEEEWRKRKKLQSLRRMEAKRRRSEKQRSSREKMEVNLLEEDKQPGRANNVGVGPPFGLQSRAASARQITSQGSIGSLGRSSSSMSEMENKALQVPCIAGAGSCGEARSSGSIQSLQDQGSQEAACSSGKKTSDTCHTPELEAETLSKTVENKGKERGSAMEDMPCVFTKGDGPNGKRIEGILYKYGKGEEVRIMCVCHGNFLSPAEFVKHAGGGDVDHPLRHIVVNPNYASFF
ncbi:ninja-family protein AFP2 isoform X1 [Gossypium raimondii]|uniref:ninja-family protein AFP2 isoform X1 n=1 Tax=Gossypium raimondii TaxID=29730 RepID=UPI00063AC5F6|nr:ninja-family protein AFP2 isoform X1 [Gossypium raimondii]